jgi:hypothetical protein
MNRWLVLTLLILPVIAFSGARASAGEVLRLSQNIPGDSKSISLYANEIATWTEGSRRIFLLKGMVLAEHGVVAARMKQAIAWVDQERTRRTGIMHLDLLADGDVTLENGSETRTGQGAVLDFNTRGELKLKSHNGKVNQQPQPTDPLYRQAQAQGLLPAMAPPPPPAPVLQRTSAWELPSEPTPGVRPAVALEQSSEGPFPARPVTPPPGPSPSPFPPAPVPPPPPPPPGPGPPGPVPDPGPPSFPLPGPRAPGPSSSNLPPSPPGPPAAAVPAPGAPPAAAQGPPRQFRLAPRTGNSYDSQTVPLPNGEKAIVVTGGIILTVRTPGSDVGLVDIEADRVVIWTHENFQQLFNGLRGPQGHTTRDLEVYLAGNVEIRERNGPENRTIRADEVYYDVSRSVAVAYRADLEFKQPGLPEPVHVRGDEVFQLSPTQFKMTRAAVFSSRLPSDPGLTIEVAEGTLEEKRVPKKTIFGFQFVDRRTGLPETEQQRLFHGDDVLVKVEDVPIFYLPFIQGDANDPFGPLENGRFSYNRIFGLQVGLTFNVFDLIGVDPIPGTRWKLFTDYLTRRGPALGTEYDYAGNNLFDLPGKYAGVTKAYGIFDTGTDILGGGRGGNEPHPDFRGRFLQRHYQELPDDFTVQLQVAVLSDKNFLEQYYKDEFDRDLNQETFLYVKQQHDSWAWTVLTEPRIRDWVTETEWLPRVDGYLIGQSFFDLFTYNAHADLAYAQLRPTIVPPPPFSSTDQKVDTGRFDLRQELNLPFTLGFLKVVPYGILELTEYTQDLTGNERGRVYGAGGVRASFPLTRLYPDVQSDLFNLNGLNHKIVTSLSYFAAKSDTPFTDLPQLDRLNDDATDQALRDIKPKEPAFNPSNGLFLMNSPLFDPQVYAIRRLVDDRVDTLDTIDEVQLDIRQRLQTKRGYPGLQHVVDFMTLDLSGSYFPHSNRDNFGEPFAFLQYDYTWNIGDRTALVSTGWVDPIDHGARVFTIGSFLNRPDRTSFYLGYREIEPLQSQAVTAAVTYVFSPKYAMTGSTTYDFGTGQSLSNSIVFTRMGSDLQVNVGFTYNAILSTFGVVFEILPNFVTHTQRIPGMTPFGAGVLPAH